MTIRNQRLSLLKQPISSTLNQHLIDYPTPSNLSYWWGFGSLAGICLVIRIVTSIFLAMHYIPHVDLAFNSRRTHYERSPREFVRCLAVVIFLLMIVTAFIGYVLPWASAIAIVGDTIVTWLWGGFSVDNATLNRFFSLHHLLPFILVGASLLHPAALHQYGSNNPLGVHSEMDKIASYPYFYVKDLVGWVAFAIFFSIWIFYAPNVLGYLDNYIPSKSMSTPPHIVPRNSTAFICLLDLPFFKSIYVRSSSFHPIHQEIFWLLLAPFVTIGQISPLVFFLFFSITPILGRVGRGIPNSYMDETDHTPISEKFDTNHLRVSITPRIYKWIEE
ncbi:unnamed protein product [Withania somnifera]